MEEVGKDGNVENGWEGKEKVGGWSNLLAPVLSMWSWKMNFCCTKLFCIFVLTLIIQNFYFCR